ncbi:hypothetical protein AX16_002122 [Volvariella volvacea WC 439]|nr:hypothetical protein AX16_002122 [Volvariella volvacea WC 439]
MTYMDIHSLPSDLWFEVASHLLAKSLTKLRLASQSWNSIAAPLVLRHVRFEANFAPRWTVIDRLRFFATSFPVEAVHHLTIITWTKIEYAGTASTICEDHVLAACEAIKRMKSLQSLQLEWETDSPKQASDFGIIAPIEEWQDRFLSSILIATDNRLSTLVLKPPVAVDTLPPSLLQIRGLRSLVVSPSGTSRCSGKHSARASQRYTVINRMNCISPDAAKVLRDVIRANPGLQTLELHYTCKLHPPSALQVLGSRSTTQLQHLTISNLTFPDTLDGSKSLSLQRTLSGLTTLIISPYSIPMDNLWKALMAANTQLTTLKTRSISLPMLEYLASYIGLKDLNGGYISSPTMSFTDPTISASLFLDMAFSSHLHSLRRLTLPLLEGPEWDPLSTYSRDLWYPVLFGMVNLEHVDIDPSSTYFSGAMNSEDMRSLCQAIIFDLQYLPSLKSLNIRVHFPQAYVEDNVECPRYLLDQWASIIKIAHGLITCTGRPERLRFRSCFTEFYADFSDEARVWVYTARNV